MTTSDFGTGLFPGDSGSSKDRDDEPAAAKKASKDEASKDEASKDASTKSGAKKGRTKKAPRSRITRDSATAKSATPDSESRDGNADEAPKKPRRRASRKPAESDDRNEDIAVAAEANRGPERESQRDEEPRPRRRRRGGRGRRLDEDGRRDGRKHEGGRRDEGRRDEGRRDERRDEGRRDGRRDESKRERGGQPLPKRQSATQRLAVLADLESLEQAATTELDGHLSPIGLLEQIGGGRNVPRSVAYFGREQRGRSETLRGAGFDTLIGLEDRCERLVQIAVDAAALAGRVDSVVVATADIGLLPVVEFLRQQGLRVELATFAEAGKSFSGVHQGVAITTLGAESVFTP